jgi:hypothetical protein
MGAKLAHAKVHGFGIERLKLLLIWVNFHADARCT